MIAAAPNRLEDREVAAASLRTFMLLPASQRSSVILSDVLGYSLQEICEFAGGSVPAVKAALQRGRPAFARSQPRPTTRPLRRSPSRSERGSRPMSIASTRMTSTR